MDKGWMKLTKKQDCDAKRWGKEGEWKKAVRTMSCDEAIEAIASWRDGDGEMTEVTDSKVEGHAIHTEVGTVGQGRNEKQDPGGSGREEGLEESDGLDKMQRE